MKKHDEKLDKNRLKLTSFVALLMGFSQAVLIYVISTYFKTISGIENVGIFYVISYGISLFIFLNLHKLIRVINKANVFYFSVFLKIIVITGLIFTTPSKIGLFLLMFYIILCNIEWVMLDIIIENFSTDRHSGRIRGMNLMIINTGFLFGPFVSTYILKAMGFHGIFIFLLIFNSFIFIFSLISFRNVNHVFKQNLKVLDVFKKILKHKDILKIYYIAFILDFFYALMTIYTPIYLRNLGYSWEKIGLIFTIMLIPFILVQYPAGFLADKKTGEKEFLLFSLLIMGISTISLYFIGVSTIYVWATMLFITRIGAALIEILRDSYFYKKVDAHDVDMINFFRTSLPMGYIFASITSSFVFIFLPMKYAFILTGAVVLSAIYPAFFLRDNKSEEELRISK